MIVGRSTYHIGEAVISPRVLIGGSHEQRGEHASDSLGVRNGASGVSDAQLVRFILKRAQNVCARAHHVRLFGAFLKPTHSSLTMGSVVRQDARRGIDLLYSP